MPRNPTLVHRASGWVSPPPTPLPTCRFHQKLFYFFIFFKYNKSLKNPVRGAGSAQVQIRSYRNRQSGNLARKVRNAFPMCKALKWAEPDYFFHHGLIPKCIRLSSSKMITIATWCILCPTELCDVNRGVWLNVKMMLSVQK